MSITQRVSEFVALGIQRAVRMRHIIIYGLPPCHHFPTFFGSVSSPLDRLCGLVVRVSGYRYRGPGFDPRRYQIF